MILELVYVLGCMDFFIYWSGQLTGFVILQAVGFCVCMH